MASLAQLIASDAEQNAQLTLPRFSEAARPKPQLGSTTANPLVAGVSSGIDQLQSMGGAFVAAIGDVVGAKGIKDWGVGVAERNSQEAAAVGRSDLDQPLWEQNFSNVPAWLGYRTAQQVPQWAAQMLGGAVLGRGLQRAGAQLPDAAAELGARAPKALGGGGAGFGVGPVTREAMDTGRAFATDVAGAAAVGYPLAVGSMYGEAIDRGDPDSGDAVKALAMGPVYAALDAVQPAQIKGLLKRGNEGKLATRMLTAAFAGAAMEAPQEAVQTAMELTFRPDMSPAEKFRSILDAAVTGAAVGGFVGGAAGIRRSKSPNEITDEEMKGSVEGALADVPKGPAPPLTLDPTQPQQEAVRPFAKEPIERVQSMLADVESRLSAGGSTQQDAINRAQLRRELAARVAEVQPERALAQVPDVDLQTAIAAYDAKVQTGQATEQEAEVARRTQEELAARAQEGARLQQAVKVGPNQPAPRQFETPVIPGFEQLPTQRTPAAEFAYRENIAQIQEQKFAERKAAKDNAVLQAQQQVAAMGGLKAVPKSFEKANIQTLEDGFAHVKERLDRGNAPQWAIAAGKYIGYLDEKGNDQTSADVQEKLDQNTSKLQDLYQKYQTSGRAQKFADQITELQQQNSQYIGQLQMLQKAEEAYQVRERERNPPTSIAPGPARLRGPDGTYRNVEVLGKPPTTVEGRLYQSVRTDNGVETMVPIASLWPTQGSAPVQEASSPSPDAAQAEARRPLPMTPRVRDQTIPDLRSPLWQNTEQGREVTPPPLRGEVDTFTVPPETDQQRLARRRVEGDYFAGENDIPDPRPLDEKIPTLDEQLDRATYRRRYEPLLSELVSDKSLPREFRKRAAQARQQFRGGDSNISVEELLAEYAAMTGDFQMMRSGPGATLSPEQRAAVRQAIERALTASPQQGLRAVRQALSGNIEQNIANPQQSLEARAAADLPGFIENPDGPFKDATRNVVTSASVDPRYGDFLTDIMAQIGFDNIRVFMFHPEDMADYKFYGIHGPYGTAMSAVERKVAGGIGPFGPGMRDFYIVLDKTLTPERALETISHELGHMVMTVALAKAPQSTRDAIRVEYKKWRADAENMSAQELAKALRNRYTANALVGQLPAELRAINMPNAESYWLSENEWFADQVSRWATTSKKPLTAVEKFFSKVAAMMKSLLRTLIGGNYLPNQTVADFMDQMTENTTPIDWQGLIQYDDNIVQQDMLAGVNNISVKAANERLRRIMDAGRQVLKNALSMDVSEMSNQLNKSVLAMATVNHITDMYSKLFKPNVLAGYRSVLELHRGISNRFAHLQAEGYQMWEALSAQNKKAAEGVQMLMGYTASDIDPRKKWEEHEHLHGMYNAELLKKSVAEANQLYRNMQRIVLPDGKRASDVYDTALASNEMERYATQAIQLYNLVQTEPTVVESFKNGLLDPMAAFLNNATINENPMAARKFWLDARDAMMRDVGEYIEAQNGRLGTLSNKEAREVRETVRPLQSMLAEIGKQDARMKQAPYFHLGRFGDYFASFRVKLDAEGNVPQSTLQKIARLVEQGGFSLSVPIETVRDNMYFRFETMDEAVRFEELMKKLDRDGTITWLPREGQTQPQEPKLGQRGESAFNREPKFAAGLIAHLKSEFEDAALMDDLTPEQIEQRRAIIRQYERLTHQYFENLLPDSSILKVNLQRHNVAGFSPDMMRSYAFRASLGADAMSRLYTAPKMTAALAAIKDDVDDAKVLNVSNAKTRYTKQNVLFEILKRESNRAVVEYNTFYDMLRALNHNYFLALSPSYVLTQLTSLGTLVWPKLASKHGYMKSFEAMKDTTPMAFRILREVIAVGSEGTWQQAFDATISSKVLDRAKVPVSDREYLLRLANAGLFDMGTQSRELGRVTDGQRGSKFEMAMRIGSSFGYYSEMVARISAALAAKKLYTGPKNGLDNYARDVVIGSMFEYSNWNTGRAFGRDGVLGQFTPVTMAFMSYTAQLIELLGREIHKGYVDKTATAQDKKEARRFLAAHMVAITGIAGTLGLPAASLFAVAVNNMADILGDDDEPFDVKLAYRNWLASVFGEGVGEVIARGLPRAIGFDISSRVGEADIIPFTRLLADRRTFGEAFDSYTSEMWGAPISMIRNVGEGAAQIVRGDVVEGSRVMLPQAFKGLIGAYKMAEGGYRDKKGNELPISADAIDIMWQSLGLAPADKATYDENYRSYQATRGQMVRQAAMYRKDLIRALEDNDMEAARELIMDIRRFDERNPAYAILPSIPSALARRQRERETAKEFNIPLGVKPELADRYGFGNLQ